MNGQQQGYPEELQIVVDKMKANREPQFNIDIMVQSSSASQHGSCSEPEPTPVACQQSVYDTSGLPQHSTTTNRWGDTP